MYFCKYIKDFIHLSKLEKLEVLNLEYSYISEISPLEKNKNIKELNLYKCWKIKKDTDYSFLAKLQKLEKLNLYNTNISDISFLENNKNIKELNLYNCWNIKDYSILSKLKSNHNRGIYYGDF